ncbi:GNAT family N-acetyltransferase [Legionella maioricensis]|uniref:GNAT family N-acetyltransferase n=1 Tax=Legionella maioricensis TaxID=2896528 RepID=A0A9X2D0M1_9GAMM|nr:GNAT family N-acetyltransferase [Legionella maioricensis]MCL9687175.1 GNAT family N-acetyltransferase [Legionella maioricensis]
MNSSFQELSDEIYEVKQDNLIFSSDRNKLNITYLHEQLSSFYWAKNISLHRLAKSLRHSVCYGLYEGYSRQLGFARVVTDFSQEAMLCDVFIDRSYQNQGLGRFLIKNVLESPITKECFRWVLLTQRCSCFLSAIWIYSERISHV